MSFLDLLGIAINDDLTWSERTRVRMLLAGQTPSPNVPWPSGIPDERQLTPLEQENIRLQCRIGELELGVKVLADLLTERGLLEPNGLAQRIGWVKEKLVAEQREREEAEQRRVEEARRAAEARTVTCAACGATVRHRESFLSSAGTICPTCHAKETGG